ncbi:hypothetical protein T261_04703 [Streptomyces lydicus]|nr:hypothetical protein T261_04703 [Streptomyces lydicus]
MRTSHPRPHTHSGTHPAIRQASDGAAADPVEVVAHLKPVVCVTG